MQSTVTKRGRGTNDDDVTEERLDQGEERLQRKLNNDDLLDDNDMERILSRPSLSRRKLEIFEAPEFVQRLNKYQESIVGDTIAFSGQYKAFPRPTVKWFKDEEEVSETSRHNIDLSSEAEGIVRLIIQEVIRQDEGAYKCKVENQEGVASTTGYLSVSGKPSDKGHSNQTKKVGIAQDRVSTAPFLRPIVEQKSMEEREEKEYQCLPPSPLQEFMDNIRHGAKSMHGPIVYADLGEVYSDEDFIKDYDNETAGEEEDVFDEEPGNQTPSASPVYDLRLEDTFKSSKDKSHLPGDYLNEGSQAIYEFLSHSIGARNVDLTREISSEDSAYDSDSYNSQVSGLYSGKDDVPNITDTDSSRRSRRKRLVLQRSHAVELPDKNTSSSSATTLAKISRNSQIVPDVERHEKDSSFSQQIHTEIDSQVNIMLKYQPVSEDGTKVFRKLAVDVAFSWIDSPWIQFFTGFVMSAVVLALVAEVPAVYVVCAVFILSFISFAVLEQLLTTE